MLPALGMDKKEPHKQDNSLSYLVIGCFDLYEFPSFAPLSGETLNGDARSMILSQPLTLPQDVRLSLFTTWFTIILYTAFSFTAQPPFSSSVTEDAYTSGCS